MRKSNFELKIKKLNYKNYYKKYKLERLIDTQNFKKKNFSPSYIFNNNNKSVYLPDIKDLIRLHYTVTSRKVTKVLEFGVGYSTIFIADALRHNSKKYSKFVNLNLRRSNPFKVHSVDSNKKYLNLFKKKLSKDLKKYIYTNFSSATITSFKGQICSKLTKIPNVAPDLIYIDGPSFLDIKGSIDGIHFNNKDRTTLNCNILRMENFLLPGTLIIWDGQTNNARFNSANFVRKWHSKRLNDIDISFSEQIESPLGYLNKKQINFSGI